MLKIERIELYKKVWEVSMICLSKEFGVKDEGLRKAYKRYDIPTPKIGYWRGKMKAYFK